MLFSIIRNKKNSTVFETILEINKFEFNKLMKRGYKPMNTLDRDFLINHGFQEDTDKKVLSELFFKHNKFKEVNISVNLTEPSMLLA